MRTENQSLANGFDQQLADLIQRGERYASVGGSEGHIWESALWTLRHLRMSIRSMMTEQDRKETGG